MRMERGCQQNDSLVDGLGLRRGGDRVGVVALRRLLRHMRDLHACPGGGAPCSQLTHHYHHHRPLACLATVCRTHRHTPIATHCKYPPPSTATHPPPRAFQALTRRMQGKTWGACITGWGWGYANRTAAFR